MQKSLIRLIKGLLRNYKRIYLLNNLIIHTTKQSHYHYLELFRYDNPQAIVISENVPDKFPASPGGAIGNKSDGLSSAHELDPRPAPNNRGCIIHENVSIVILLLSLIHQGLLSVIIIYHMMSRLGVKGHAIKLCLFLLLYVPCQQLWSLRDGQFT